ncbi:MAG: peptide deformylase [Gemmatimonadetes bacterium]|nr:peptide deformylase [Gemmatimonadota bacterium]NNK61774.1 peptide deformylase [Gemmatimonadota bacterium]
MALRPIVLMGDPVLRETAAPVESFDERLRALIEDMFETMYHAEGVGLAAPQIGLSERVLVVDVRNEDEPEAGRFAIVNPEIVAVSRETDKATEGCLSIPGLEESVERPAVVEVKGFDAEGRPFSVEADDLLGRALQHEIDHLDGVLFVDRVSPLKRQMLLKRWRKLQEEVGS